MAVRKRRKADDKRPEVVAEIEPAVLIVPPHITSYLYKAGVQEEGVFTKDERDTKAVQ